MHANALDVHLPISGYKTLQKMKAFNVIYPLEFYVPQQIAISTIVRLIAWEDHIYMALMNQEDLDPSLMVVKGMCYYDIEYIRDTSLRKVMPGEWSNNWGPLSREEWLEEYPNDTLDRNVRIVCVSRPNYDLKLLNKVYKSKFKGGR